MIFDGFDKKGAYINEWYMSAIMIPMQAELFLQIFRMVMRIDCRRKRGG
jgi:hypothetical protein